MLCDNCYRQPEPFTTDEGKTAYWVILDKNGDGTVLMSDLSERFRVCQEINTEIPKEEMKLCISCFLHTNEDDIENSPNDK